MERKRAVGDSLESARAWRRVSGLPGREREYMFLRERESERLGRERRDERGAMLSGIGMLNEEPDERSMEFSIHEKIHTMLDNVFERKIQDMPIAVAGIYEDACFTHGSTH